MDKTRFHKEITHTSSGDLPQYNCKEKVLLKVFSYNGKFEPELHSHQFYLILWIKKGSGIHSINFKDYPLKDNQIFFLAPGDVHRGNCMNGEIEQIGIPFRDELLKLLPLNVADWIRLEIFNNIGDAPNAIIDTGTAETLNKWIEQLKDLLTDSDKDTDYCAAATLSVILKLLKKRALWNNKFMTFPPKKLEILYKFRKSINDNLKKTHSPASYSEKIGVAESKLSAVTKELRGLSPRKIINEEIIIKAKRLLAEGNLIIKEISEELGFADAPHFVKFFKKETGMTPNQFKENL